MRKINEVQKVSRDKYASFLIILLVCIWVTFNRQTIEESFSHTLFQFFVKGSEKGALAPASSLPQAVPSDDSIFDPLPGGTPQEKAGAIKKEWIYGTFLERVVDNVSLSICKDQMTVGLNLNESRDVPK